MSDNYEVSNSEIKTFRQCRRKWWLTYIMKLRSRDVSVVGPLPLGSRVHKALELYYRGEKGLLQAHEDLVAEARATAMIEGADLSKLDDEAELGRLMLDGYLEWAGDEGIDANLEIIGIEEILKYPMLGGAVTLIGKLDLRVRDRMKDTRLVLDFKHLEVHEPVLTPGGWVEIGSIEPGDTVIGSRWQPVRVLGHSERSIQKTYRVEFTDGTYSLASDEHPWPTHLYKQSAPQKIRTTAEIQEFLGRPGQRDIYITAITPDSTVAATDPDVDPYLLGCWLANGSAATNHGSTRIHDGAAESSVLVEAGLAVKQVDETNVLGAGTSSLNQYLRTNALMGEASTNRWIPWDAMMASVTFRSRLLSGLMDSDGSVTGASSTVYYTSSERLGEDVALLVRSLGGHASIWKHTDPKYTYRGENRYGQDAYRVNIRTKQNPFTAHHKNVAKWNDIESRRKVSRQHVMKKVKSVEYIGERECVCLMVEADDHLFITRGGTPTHNTAANFNEFNLTGHMNPQLKTYQMLDTLVHPEGARIEGGIYRLLKKVKRTARATPPFYEDITIRHNKYALRSFWEQLQGVLHDMVTTRNALLTGGDPMALAYPNPTRDCTWQCPFINVCPMFDDGSDVESAINDHFTETDPYAYYGEGSESEPA